jgi:DNA repair protein RecN (Recombination protein N)
VLEELHVANLGVVGDATLQLADGLNVLSGETGAGKTLIAVGLSLALGSRAGSGLVKAGSAAASVEARFRLAPAGADVDLGELIGEGDGDPLEVVLGRSVGAEGRSSARLNGRLAPVSVLASVGERLVEIHGQNQASRLLSPVAQTAFLDRFAGKDHERLVDELRASYARLRAASEGLRALDTAVREREREKDLLAYQIREIEAAHIAPGEMASLAGDETRLEHAGRILELAEAAERSIGEEGGATDRLAAAATGANAILTLDPGAEALVARVRSVAAEIADVVLEVRRYRESVEVDPERLAVVQERVRALKALERKYGDGEEGILAYLVEASGRLRSLEGEDAERDALEARVRELSARAASSAARVTDGRSRAIPRLARALTREVRALGMPGADVTIDVHSLEEPTGGGAERVEFGFSGGPGQPQLPLARAASGGELSRVMLACRSVLAELDDVATLVFDEVDAGIGGRTAVAVAERLAQVATRRQVLVVTHLAQIAARADRHFLVTKDDGAATVRALDGEDRVEELARMLSGGLGKASLAHARELIGAPAG